MQTRWVSLSPSISLSLSFCMLIDRTCWVLFCRIYVVQLRRLAIAIDNLHLSLPDNKNDGDASGQLVRGAVGGASALLSLKWQSCCSGSNGTLRSRKLNSSSFSSSYFSFFFSTEMQFVFISFQTNRRKLPRHQVKQTLISVDSHG